MFLPSLQMDFTCFSSSDPAAHRASLLFDFYNDDENLWSRSSSDVPLPSCSSSPPPPDSRCLVCVQHAVSAVCRNLADGVKVMLEAGADQVQISKSGKKLPAFCSSHPLILTYINSSSVLLQNAQSVSLMVSVKLDLCLNSFLVRVYRSLT